VVIIDESSMIGNQFLKAIVDIVKKRALKLLFVGDPFQLPPPTDICSIFDGSLYTFKLTTVHRQSAGNPVLEKANEFREYIEGIRNTEPTLETNINSKGEGIHVLPHSEFVTKFVQKYIDYATGAEVDIPLCTYTNESAINYNSMVRKAAYFLEDTIEPFYKGERLIANSIVTQGDKTILTNNEIVYVTEYFEGESYDIPGYYVIVTGAYNQYTRSNSKKVFSPKTKIAADKILNKWKADAVSSKSKKGWQEYYKIKNSLADLRPPFAGTTHKAQGGTFPAVFIDKLNINKCKNPATRARLFYVALTRASKNVYINS
jgi:exodeoxyribonuclease-5